MISSKTSIVITILFLVAGSILFFMFAEPEMMDETETMEEDAAQVMGQPADLAADAAYISIPAQVEI
jgi:hypothetical protein